MIKPLDDITLNLGETTARRYYLCLCKISIKIFFHISFNFLSGLNEMFNGKAIF